MSKSTQLNFFIVPDDLPEINDFLKSKGILFVKLPILPGGKVFADDIMIRTPEENPKTYLAGKKFEKKLRLWQNDEKSPLDVDVVRSYVIEFNRGGFSPEGILQRGKFFALYTFDDNGKILRKESEFKIWVEAVYSSFKKEFLRRAAEHKDLYFSPNALKWMKANGAKTDKSGMKAYPSTKIKAS
ncbi:MAG: hypothetical protein H7Y27_15450 [Gemmatimonadaceae bacterium]|nr:hypothetical protein [Chitinophagaceae bacterium]